MRKSGFSLPETVFAMLIMSGIFLVIFQYTTDVAKRTTDVTEQYSRLNAFVNAYQCVFTDMKSAEDVVVSDDKKSLTVQRSFGKTNDTVRYEEIENSLYRNGKLILDKISVEFHSDRFLFVCQIGNETITSNISVGSVNFEN